MCQGRGHTLNVAGLFLGQRGALNLDMRATALVPGLRTDRSRPANGLSGRIQQLQHGLTLTQTSISKLKQRNAETQTVETGQVGTLQHTRGLDIVVALDLAVDLVGDTREFQSAQTTQVVDQQDEVVTGLVCDEGAVGVVVVQDLVEHGLDQLREGGLDTVGAGLVVNTHSHLDLVTGDSVLWYRTTRDVNMFQRRTDRGQVGVGQLGQVIHFLKRATKPG